MRPDEAMAALGLAPDASWDEVRAAFRARVRETHPDLNGGDAAETARITEAYALLEAEREARPRAPRPAPPPPPPAEPAGDRLVLVAPPGEVFDRLHEAAHRLGDVSYRDRESGFIQVLVDGVNGTPCQLVIELEQVGPETRAHFTLESLSRLPAPPIESVVLRLARHLRAVG